MIRYDNEAFWSAVREGYERTSQLEDAVDDYDREADEWASLTGDALSDEPPYYSPAEEEEIRDHAKSHGW